MRWIGLMHYMQSTCSVVSRRRFKAAWIHHAFTQIHPFSDGSGRVARAIASLVFIRGGSFPLVVNRDDRADYIGALEISGAGNLHDMIGLSVRLQRRSLLTGIHAIPHELPVGLGSSQTLSKPSSKLRAMFRSAEVKSVVRNVRKPSPSQEPCLKDGCRRDWWRSWKN